QARTFQRPRAADDRLPDQPLAGALRSRSDLRELRADMLAARSALSMHGLDQASAAGAAKRQAQRLQRFSCPGVLDEDRGAAIAPLPFRLEHEALLPLATTVEAEGPEPLAHDAIVVQAAT